MKLTILITVLLITTAQYSVASENIPLSIIKNGEKITIKVKGVTCHNDLNTLKQNIEKLEGVSKCEVLKGGATAKFEVEFDPSVVTEEEIHAAIENTGGCKNPSEKPYKVK